MICNGTFSRRMAEGVSVFWRRMCIQYVPSSDCVMSFFGQAFQVGVGQPREGSEEKPVPHPLEVGFSDGSFHQLFEVFEFQMAALAPGQFRCSFP